MANMTDRIKTWNMILDGSDRQNVVTLNMQYDMKYKWQTRSYNIKIGI